MMLHFQQESFPPQSAAIPAQRPVFSNHAMAGYDQINSIRSIRSSHRPHGARIADLPGQFFIRRGLPVRNISQRVPDGDLKRRSTQHRLNRKCRESSLEIRVQLVFQTLQNRVHPRHHGQFESRTHVRVEFLQTTAVGIIEKTNALIARGGQQRSKRRFEKCDPQAFSRARLAGRRAECFHKRIAKSAVRIVAGIEDDIVQLLAFSDLRKCPRQTHSPAPTREGHSIIPLKPAPGLFRCDAHRAQLRGLQSQARFGFDLRHQVSRPLRRFASSRLGPAAFARAIARTNRFANSSKIDHMFRLRPGWARRPAKDAGCGDAEKKQPIKRRIARFAGLLHFGGGE